MSGNQTNRCSISVHSTDSRTEDRRFWSRSERRKWSLGLFVGCAVLYSSRTVMPLCIVSMAKELGWDKTDSGSILSSFFWGYMMTQFLGGYLSDRVGGDVILLMAACFWSLITFCTPYFVYVFTDKTYTLYIVVLSRILLGMAQGFHFPSMSSLISQKVNEDRSFTYAVITTGTNVGILLTGSCGSFILDHYGWQSSFYLIGFVGIIWLLCFRYCLLPRKWERRFKMDNYDGEINEEKPSVPWTKLFSKCAFWSLLIGHFCDTNSYFILLSWLPTYFHENFPTAKGWVFNVVPFLVSSFLGILSGTLADYLIGKGFSVGHVRKFMETISLCGTAFFLTMVANTSWYEAALFYVACCMACRSFHTSGTIVNPQDIAPRHAGAVFGLMNMVGAVPGFVGVYLAGYILEVTKSWAAVFHGTSILCVIGWIFYTLFASGKPII